MCSAIKCGALSKGCPAFQGGTDGDTILVYPSKIDPHCEALVFVLSASDSDVSTMNLTTPDALQFNGHSAGATLDRSFKHVQHWCEMHCPAPTVHVWVASIGANKYWAAFVHLVGPHTPADGC